MVFQHCSLANIDAPPYISWLRRNVSARWMILCFYWKFSKRFIANTRWAKYCTQSVTQQEVVHLFLYYCSNYLYKNCNTYTLMIVLAQYWENSILVTAYYVRYCNFSSYRKFMKSSFNRRLANMARQNGRPQLNKILWANKILAHKQVKH